MPARDNPLHAYVNLALAMVIVGSSVVAGKIMVDGLPLFLASSLRFLLALVLLVPLLYFREGGFPRLSRASRAKLCLQALCGSFLFTVFLLYGLKYTSPATAGIITSTTPACIGLIAWLFLKERPTSRTIKGVALSVLGVLCVNAVGTGGNGAAPLFGNLLVLAAVVFESLFLLMRKTVPEPLSPTAAATLVSFYGLLLFLPFGAYEAAHADFAAVPVSAWLSTAYYGVFVTVLAYLFWFAGITRVPAAAAGVFTAVMPVSALALSALVLGEPLTPLHIIGCLCVLGGIYSISRTGVGGRRSRR